MVRALHRPRSAAEAISLLEGKRDVFAMGGGTELLSGEFAGRSFEAVCLEGLVPGSVDRRGAVLEIGAAATFQDLLDSKAAPVALQAAAAGMGSRNIRNRATVGGNLGADKACSSLIPVLLALGARLRLLDGRETGLEDWLGLGDQGEGRPIVASIALDLEAGRKAGYARWARVACDLSVLSAAASYRLEGGKVTGLRLALGGVAARARRSKAIEALFEGRPLPDREAVEALVMKAASGPEPAFAPISDQRGSADFKRLRAASLVADAFAGARDLAEGAGTAGGRK